MFEIEKRIEELKEENKSLKVKAVILGLFSLSQTSMLLLEKFQNNIFTIVGLALIALGIGTISVISSLMIKKNNSLINKYKQF
jgi:hypothetical protein